MLARLISSDLFLVFFVDFVGLYDIYRPIIYLSYFIIVSVIIISVLFEGWEGMVYHLVPLISDLVMY